MIKEKEIREILYKNVKEDLLQGCCLYLHIHYFTNILLPIM